MGAYLSEPVVDKQTESEKGVGGIHYGVTSMQGWRINQEDAHNCILDFDENCAFFAVYDGHGGAEVAQYASTRFPQFLKSFSAWREGRLGEALEEAFLTFDEHLTRNDVMDELKMLAGAKKKDSESDGDADDDKAALYEEACLPLDELLQRYGLTIDRRLLIRGTEGRLSGKIKIKGQKGVLANVGLTEEGPRTPPSSPEARASTDSCSPSTTSKRSQLTEPLPTSLQDNDADCTVRPAAPDRIGVKRKSRLESDGKDGMDEGKQTKEHCALEEDEHGSSESNGTAKTGADGGADSPVDGINVKRFKDGQSDGASANGYNEMGTVDCTSKKETSEDDGCNTVNGSHLLHSSQHSTTGDGDAGTKRTKRITLNTGAAGNMENMASPMMVEENSSTNRIDEEKGTMGNRQHEEKSCAMDALIGASDDEDYNMEVEDEEEECSEESGGSDGGIDEDEQDEMGVDECDGQEEEDDEMFAMPSGDTPGVDSGTTACVVVIKGSKIYVANAGDSRCVLCRGDKAVDLSFDHKPEDPVEKQRIESAGGKITGDGRVNGGLNLSRAIGDHFYKQNCELPLRDQMITALPDVRIETMTTEDRFIVVACDGIWNSMSSQDVVDFVRTRLANGIEVATICEQLCDVCLAPNTIGDGTGCDNMTAVIVLLNQNSSSIGATASDHGGRAEDGRKQ